MHHESSKWIKITNVYDCDLRFQFQFLYSKLHSGGQLFFSPDCPDQKKRKIHFIKASEQSEHPPQKNIIINSPSLKDGMGGCWAAAG